MDGMKYLKWLNLIPLIMFFIVDKLRGTLISRYLLIIIVALGIMNMFLAKRMKEYLFASLMLVASIVVGMILYTYYYYYFVSANSETPIFSFDTKCIERIIHIDVLPHEWYFIYVSTFVKIGGGERCLSLM